MANIPGTLIRTSAGDPIPSDLLGALKAGTNITIGEVIDAGDKKVEIATSSGVLSNIVEDLTPQLGGDLDGNDKDITNVKSLIIDGTSTEAFLVRKDGDAGDVFVVDTVNSRVGIGIVPLVLFHIGGSGTKSMRATTTSDVGSISMVLDNNTSAVQQFAMRNYGTAAAGSFFGVSNANLGVLFKSGTGDLAIGTLGVGDLVFGTNNTEAIHIDSNGNVGIGIPTPSQALDLIGALELENTATSTTGVIYKGSDRFIHNFRHPTGDTARPDGLNTFVGIDAGNFTIGSTATLTIEGSCNTGMGINSLSLLTTGFSNTGVGFSSLSLVTTGSRNTGVGVNSLSSLTTGSRNTSIGRSSLSSLTTGIDNCAIGKGAGNFLLNGIGLNQTTENSIYIGNDTRAFADGVTNEIVFGDAALGLGSNTVVLGNMSIVKTRLNGNVGIDTSGPSSKLDVAGDIEIGSADNFFYGDPTTDTTWKTVRSGTKLSFQRRETGAYVEKGFFDASFHSNKIVLENDGSIGVPALSFASDPDTGLFRQADNVLSMIAGGVESIRASSVINAINCFNFIPSKVGS